MPQNNSSLMVTKDHAVAIQATPAATTTVTNAAGDTLFYADHSQVSASNNQGNLTASNGQMFSGVVYVRSAGVTSVTVTSITTPGTTISGSLVLGSGAPLPNAATDGFLYIPTVAGTPTGVPTAHAGSVPIVFDT